MARKLSETFAQVDIIDQIDLNYNGKSYSAQWLDLYNSSELGRPKTFPSLLVIVDEFGEAMGECNGEPENELKDLAVRKRLEMLREEMGVEPITDPYEIQRILDRVWSGEWMGQSDMGGSILGDTLQEILNLDHDAYKEVEESLIRTGMVTVIGGSGCLYAPDK
ncbi:MAG: hypothetical protein H9W81_13620 [Enterococcus sp.]|nr:hypothetical protein [Enterococcus sp.]